jgi:hypothetical protein
VPRRCRLACTVVSEERFSTRTHTCRSRVGAIDVDQPGGVVFALRPSRVWSMNRTDLRVANHSGIARLCVIGVFRGWQSSRSSRVMTRFRPCCSPSCLSADQTGVCALGSSARAVNFRALLHRRVRSADSRCQASTPYPSMGFGPLRGPSPPLSFQPLNTEV